jgi:DNA repair protein RecO (recombination protein O)
MPSYNTEAISLRLQPFGEAGGLALLFTRERGRITALCQGIRKMGSRLASAVQPGTYSVVSLAEGARRDILTQAEVKDGFPEVRAELPRLGAALYLLDLLAGASATGQREDRLFDLALEALSTLKKHPDPLAVVTAFELCLLEIHGTPVSLDHCAVCGSEALGDEWLVSVTGGGRVCSRCRANARPVAHLTAEAGKCLLAFRGRRVGSPPEMPARAAREVRGFLSRFIEYHLGQDFKSRDFMNSVLLSRSGKA